MVMQPEDACKTCGGSYWVLDLEAMKGDEEPWPTQFVEKPCPDCNPHGMHPKVYY